MKPRKIYVLLEVTSNVSITDIKTYFKNRSITFNNGVKTFHVDNVKVDVVQPVKDESVK